MMDETFLVAPAFSGSFLVRRRQKMIFENSDIDLKTPIS
jgi:hypothetical protein